MDLPAPAKLVSPPSLDEFDSYPYDSFDDDGGAAFGSASLSPQAVVDTQQS